MRISGISSFNFAKSPKKANVTKQKIRIFNPEPEKDPDKILVIMGKNPALFCSGGFELRSIAADPARGFIQTVSSEDSEE